MKTLEITTASGTYIVLDLPEDAIRPNIQDFSRLHYTVAQWDKLTQVENSEFEMLPIGDWEYELIGPGKDHPEFVEELGLLSENTVKPGYTHFEESTMEAVQRYNKQLVDYEQAEKRVFKNPFILRKND